MDSAARIFALAGAGLGIALEAIAIAVRRIFETCILKERVWVFECNFRSKELLDVFDVKMLPSSAKASFYVPAQARACSCTVNIEY